MESGVPQGSVLGPTLFLVMMNKIDSRVNRSSVGSFADDSRLWSAISGIHAAIEMQDDLNTVYEWANSINMKFNQSKFEAITFGKGERVASYSTPNGTPITQITHVKDLGITIQDNLKFDRHISTIAAKGHRMIGWSLRTFKTRQTKTMLTILKSLVLSQCEYGSIIWSPRNRAQINLLESVQKKYTSRLARFQSHDNDAPSCNTDYPTRIKILGLLSMERRRERYAIIYAYKIVINIVPNPGFVISYDPRRKITIKPKSDHRQVVASWIRNARNHSFYTIGPMLYNSLPAYLRELEEISTPTKNHINRFKNRLQKYLITIADIPGSPRNSLIPQ